MRPEIFRTEDWWAIWLGGLLLVGSCLATWINLPAKHEQIRRDITNITSTLDAMANDSSSSDEERESLKKQRNDLLKSLHTNPMMGMIVKLGSWDSNPVEAFYSKSTSLFPALLATFCVLAALMSIGIGGMGQSVFNFMIAFACLFLLAILSFLLANQNVIQHYNLESALWAIMLGLIISNTVGTPAILQPAVRTEFYIKTGLVLLGAEILFQKLLALGLPGICISWVTTPIVLVSTYIFGQKVLKIQSRSLNMVISADMSVCGVSAAIATGAACRAKKEELSLAIALSMGFTVIMMILMPKAIQWMGMSDVLAGAWIGGTIDSTGAVAAAGEMINETALTVATTIKMIQNILIGVIAFAVSIYWVGWVEKSESNQRVGLGEIWKRFPKFMIGFVGASILFSVMSASGEVGEAIATAVQKGTTVPVRNWLFCLAFVSIGLETRISEFIPYFKSGKPMVLYVVGQTLNLVATLGMAWLVFEKVFPHAKNILKQ